jgi:hypothetical protein
MTTMVDGERVDRADTVTLLDGALVSLRRLDEPDAETVIAFHRDQRAHHTRRRLIP